MIAPTLTTVPVEEATEPCTRDLVGELRARAFADAKRLRALARSARTDGLPMSALRAANATAAARSVLRHAQRQPSLCPGRSAAIAD